MHHRRWLPTLLPLLLAAPLEPRAGGTDPAILVAVVVTEAGGGDPTYRPPSRAGSDGGRRVLSALAARAVVRPDTERRRRSPEATRRLVRTDTTRQRGRSGGGETRPGILGDFMDLGLRVTGRGELGGSWSRFWPCDPTFLLQCNPSPLPLLKPEVQFGIQIGGTIAERIHLDVDYDQRREFGGVNRINVYYQGLAGEVLQRVELGDVSIDLPNSRYLTEGVPGGNFGFKASARFGPVELQTIWAQQQGELSRREFRLGRLQGAEGLLQEARLTLDDADYVKGQFFFVVDPADLIGYPHLDILALRPEQAPSALRPAPGGELYVYRDERPSLISPEQRAQLGYFLAEAISSDGEVRHRGRFRRLVAGEDYWVHPSGLWLMLRVPLRMDEALAVSYVTAAGRVVGTPEAEAVAGSSPPELLLVRGPASVHHPSISSWRFEMRQVYRLDASPEVEPGSVELSISLGEGASGVSLRRMAGRPWSFLKLFGLDEDLPGELLDEARIFQPGRAAGSLTGIDDPIRTGPRFGGSYLVFPTLRPFAEPPAVPSAGLTAEEVRVALGSDLNPVIYDDPDPIRRRDGGRFRLEIRYRFEYSAVASTFNLGAFGIREGSEVVQLGNRTLRRGIDYLIDYELGQITLSDAQALFALDPDAELRVVWEQKSIFRLAPRTLFGFSAHYPFGVSGGLNLVGLYQAEKAIVARPHLGTEPGSVVLGGLNGGYSFDLPWLDRLLGDGPSGDTAASRLRLGGELAVSLPNPNRRGATYLDDFEVGDDLPIGLEQRLWRLGSRPAARTGASDVLPEPLDVTTAASLVWQHELLDASGRVTGPRLAREIDRQIQLAGAQRTEPVLYLSFGRRAGDGGGFGRRWRSLTTVLSTTGRDMSRSEYLEFYAAAAPERELALVIDLGSVSEDAYYFDEEGRTEGRYPDGRRWGLGILDEEARLAEGELWSARRDSLGLWNQSCLAEPGRRAYRAGDPRANCTRGNGEIDTEDLDGNGILDEIDGAIFRYVVPLGPESPYLVRDRAATGTEFALYRIPLRGPGAIPLGGAGESTWRFIKYLRVTVTGQPGLAPVPDLALARLRIVGSRWVKRDQHGIRAGLIDDRPGLGSGITDFQVGTVSRLTDGAGYVSPPGVAEQMQDPTSIYGSTGIEYNEKSLRLVYRDLMPGERAEVYFRFPQEPRNFLAYRGLRLWALAAAGRWGLGDTERLIVGVGSDPRNRYLYQTPLSPTPPGGSIQPDHWLPELRIDFEEWFRLRAEAEALFASGEWSGGEPLVLWDADSTYGIVLEDRARAPNLAAVREIAFAIYNRAGTNANGEVWLDELRLGGAVRDAGVAGHWEVALDAGEVASATLTYGNRGALFRHLEGEASYRATSELGVHVTAQLARVLPASWGIELPLTISHTRQGHDPIFLERSDLKAGLLHQVRETGASETRIALSLRPADAGAEGGAARLLTGTHLRLGYQAARVRGGTSTDEVEGFDLGIGYSHHPARRDVPLLPDRLGAWLRALLPGPLGRSELVERLTTARLRWTPTEITASTYFDTRHDRRYRYDGLVPMPGDRDQRAGVAPRRGLENLARLQFQPFPSLAAGLTFTSGRDLLPPSRSGMDPVQRRALGAARTKIAGLDLGWERDRQVESRIEFRPLVAGWIRPGIGHAARFRGDRHGTHWDTRVVDDDTTAYLLRHYQADRRLSRSLIIDPEVPGNALSAADEAGGSGWRRTLGRILSALHPVDLTWNSGADSRFDHQSRGPGLGYHFGVGGYPDAEDDTGSGPSSANRYDGFHARGGVRLPLQTRVEVVYGTTSSVAFTRGGGRYTVEERSWPDLTLSWTELPRPGVLTDIITHGTASVGYRRIVWSGMPGVDTGARTREEASIPMRFSITFSNGLSGSYSGFLREQRQGDPTGATEQDLAQHTIQLAGRFDGPASWQESMEGPIHLALSFTLQSRRQCRISTTSIARRECVPFVDLINRQLALTLDTIISQLNVGLQMSYNDRKSFVGLRSGASQFQLAFYGEFNFEGGTFVGEGR